MKAQIIEKEGQFYKECGVVMLETTKENHGKYFVINKESKLCIWDTNKMGSQRTLPVQHLYITSDDEIKDGDWFYDELSTNKIYQRKNSHVYSLPEEAKKIIATTDPKLQIKKESRKIGGITFHNVYVDDLPSPSNKFIQAFIDAYNKGEKIEKVLVEYELDESIDGYPYNTLKLKDNNIIIKKMKDSWTREEVISLLKFFAKDTRGNSPWMPADDEWIEKNL